MLSPIATWTDAAEIILVGMTGVVAAVRSQTVARSQTHILLV